MTPLFDQPRMLDIDHVIRSSLNPRRRFSETALNELASNIKRQGVLQPILTRPIHRGEKTLYEIVAGERRWRASMLAKQIEIPSIVREMTDAEALEIAVVENAQREDLHPLEEAEGFDALMRIYGHDQATAQSAEDIAAKIGKSRTYIYNRLKLLSLIPELREAFFNDEFSASVAQQIARLPSKLQSKAITKIRKATADGDQINVRASAALLRKEFYLRLDCAPFPTQDSSLIAGAGACTTCRKASGNEPDLFGDEPDNVCTDGDCFKAKQLANNERQKTAALDRGLVVIDGDNARAMLKFGTASDELNGDYVYMDRGMQALTGVDKSLHKLLGTLLKPSALFEHPKDLTLREIVEVTKAIDALRKNALLMSDPDEGVRKKKKPAPERDLSTTVATPRDTSHTLPAVTSDGVNPWLPSEDIGHSQSADDAAIKAARTWRLSAVRKLHSSYQDSGYIDDATEAMKVVCADLCTTYLDDDETRSLILELWFAPGDFPSFTASRQDYLHMLADMNLDQLLMLMAELVAIGDVQNMPDMDPLSETTASESLVLLCTQQGLDMKAIYPTDSPARDSERQSIQEDVPQSEDGKWWHDQWVKVKRGPRKGHIGGVYNLRGQNDIAVCFDMDGARNDIEWFSKTELSPLPDQTNSNLTKADL